jgi:hypothetical protein
LEGAAPPLTREGQSKCGCARDTRSLVGWKIVINTLTLYYEDRININNELPYRQPHAQTPAQTRYNSADR